MNMAGELDDRWFALIVARRRAKPFGSLRRLRVNGRKVRTPLCKWRCWAKAQRYISGEEPFDSSRGLRVKGSAPGNARGRSWNGDVKSPLQSRHGKCHREQTAGGTQPGDSPEENLRDVYTRFVSQVRVKRWGKSPPRRQ